MLKTVRGDVNINYWWDLMLKTVRGDVNINYWWDLMLKTVRGTVNIFFNFWCFNATFSNISAISWRLCIFL